MLPQATASLNLLRNSRLNPRLSAEEHLNGTFDYNRTPIAPLSTRIVIHKKPTQRCTWAPHSQDGWYTGYAPEHYRCYTVYITTTSATYITDTLEFFSTQCTMPTTTSTDSAIFAARDLIHALQNPAPAAPFAHIGNAQAQALHQLATIFEQALTPNTESHTLATPSPRVDGPSPPMASPTPRVNRPSPRVEPTPTRQRVMRTPPVRVNESPQHRYPTRQRIQPPTMHTANHVATVTDHIHTLVAPEPPEPSLHLPKHFAYAVVDPDTGQSMEYQHLIKQPKTKDKWTTSFANELGRLAQGVGDRHKGTDTIFFIKHNEVPAGRKVTYGRIVVALHPMKKEVERTRLTIGGNLIDYPSDVSTKTADLTTAKLLFNSVISMPNAKFMGIDLKKFYLNTPMERYEYM